MTSIDSTISFYLTMKDPYHNLFDRDSISDSQSSFYSTSDVKHFLFRLHWYLTLLLLSKKYCVST